MQIRRKRTQRRRKRQRKKTRKWTVWVNMLAMSSRKKPLLPRSMRSKIRSVDLQRVLSRQIQIFTSTGTTLRRLRRVCMLTKRMKRVSPLLKTKSSKELTHHSNNNLPITRTSTRNPRKSKKSCKSKLRNRRPPLKRMRLIKRLPRRPLPKPSKMLSKVPSKAS